MERLTKAFFKFIRPLILNPIILFFFELYNLGINKKNILPPIKNSFMFLPAVELAKKIRIREVNMF
jgi:hypothetical protein